MTESEGRLKLALAAVHQLAESPAAAELQLFGIGGAAILCMWAAATLLEDKAALTEGHFYKPRPVPPKFV